MTFQIYWGEDPRHTMFDIEYYAIVGGSYQTFNGQIKKLWQSEISVLPLVEGLTRFILDHKDDPNFDAEQFIKDSEKIQELRGWLWESDGKNNRPSETNKEHYHERYNHIKGLIDVYASTYGLNVNTD